MARTFVGAVALLAVAALVMVAFSNVPTQVSGTAAVTLKYYTGQGTPTAFNDYRSSTSFAYWRVNFTNAKELIVAGLWLSYKTPAANLPWNGNLQVNESDGAYKQYEVSLPS